MCVWVWEGECKTVSRLTFADLYDAHDNDEAQRQQLPSSEDILDTCSPAHTGAVHPCQQHCQWQVDNDKKGTMIRISDSNNALHSLVFKEWWGWSLPYLNNVRRSTQEMFIWKVALQQWSVDSLQPIRDILLFILWQDNYTGPLAPLSALPATNDSTCHPSICSFLCLTGLLWW